MYHLRHLDLYDTTDKVLNVTALTGALVLPVIVLVAELRRPRISQNIDIVHRALTRVQ